MLRFSPFTESKMDGYAKRTDIDIYKVLSLSRTELS